jgi:hypothetical protein
VKRYLIAMYQPDGDPPPPEVLEPVMRELAAVTEEIKAAGGWVFGDGLHSPGSATVVRASGSEVLLTDGPFAEGKEHIGGLTIVRAPDLDVVLRWATRIATATTLPVEVRPFQGEDSGEAGSALGD